MNESATSSPPKAMHDVIIMGGGLSGLTLALQLRLKMPELDVLVLERRAHPVPHACHKVGESTVEIGAHYFAEVLGLKAHLEEAQLRKFGFRFFFSEGRRDIENVTELGASRPLPVTSYQIDRGLLENFLGEECQRRGIRFVDSAVIRQVQLAQDEPAAATAERASTALHQVRWQRQAASQAEPEAEQVAQARWVIDACGRAGLLKRKLNLAQENAHPVHAVWFRINQHVMLDDWSADPAWQARCVTPTRWLSTNHLVGQGYWVWLIPLSSGSHSVGIVADPRYHPIEGMNTFEKAMDWLRLYQPALFDDLDGKREGLQDFAFFRRFSYDCKQVFSTQRWALAGEAGRFLDPFYSPGSDFIAIGNTFITELVARDHAGLRLEAHTQVYEQIYRSFYESTMALYLEQYGLFGDPEVLPIKVIWDYTYYWSVLAQLFCQQRLTDLASLSCLRDELAHCQKLNQAVQDYLRAWGQVSQRRNLPVMLDQASAPWFVELNRSLHDKLDDAAFRAHIHEANQRLRQLAQELLERGSAEHPELDGSALLDLLGANQAKAEQALLFPSASALQAGLIKAALLTA